MVWGRWGLRPFINNTIDIEHRSGGIIYLCGYVSRKKSSYVGWGGAIMLFAGFLTCSTGAYPRGRNSTTFCRCMILFWILSRTVYCLASSNIWYFRYVWGTILTFLAWSEIADGELRSRAVRWTWTGSKVEGCSDLSVCTDGAWCHLPCGVFHGVTAFDPILILIIPLALISRFGQLTAFVRERHAINYWKEEWKIKNSFFSFCKETVFYIAGTHSFFSIDAVL